MCTSATERALRTAMVYLLSALGCAAFGAVYEVFSHGVWSGYMVYAFVFPLTLGTLPFLHTVMRRRPMPGLWALRLHHAGVAALTVGSIMEGVLAIYGTTNRLTAVYWIVGTALLLTSLLLRLRAFPRK